MLPRSHYNSLSTEAWKKPDKVSWETLRGSGAVVLARRVTPVLPGCEGDPLSYSKPAGLHHRPDSRPCSSPIYSFQTSQRACQELITQGLLLEKCCVDPNSCPPQALPFPSHLETVSLLPGVFDRGWITSVEVRVSSSGLQPESESSTRSWHKLNPTHLRHKLKSLGFSILYFTLVKTLQRSFGRLIWIANSHFITQNI